MIAQEQRGPTHLVFRCNFKIIVSAIIDVVLHYVRGLPAHY